MKLKLHDTVRLTVDLPQDGLSSGATGVVVAEFTDPVHAYEVEFSNDDGETVAQVALLAEQIVFSA